MWILLVFGPELDDIICLAYHSIFNRKLSLSSWLEFAIVADSFKIRYLRASSTTKLDKSSFFKEYSCPKPPTSDPESTSTLSTYNASLITTFCAILPLVAAYFTTFLGSWYLTLKC